MLQKRLRAERPLEAKVVTHCPQCLREAGRRAAACNDGKNLLAYSQRTMLRMKGGTRVHGGAGDNKS